MNRQVLKDLVMKVIGHTVSCRRYGDDGKIVIADLPYQIARQVRCSCSAVWNIPVGVDNEFGKECVNELFDRSFSKLRNSYIADMADRLEKFESSDEILPLEGVNDICDPLYGVEL